MPYGEDAGPVAAILLVQQQDREAFAISTNRSRSREIGGRRILTCLGCAGQQDAFARVSIFLVSRHYFCTRQLRSVSPIEGQMELTSHLAPVRKLSA